MIDDAPRRKTIYKTTNGLHIMTYLGIRHIILIRYCDAEFACFPQSVVGVVYNNYISISGTEGYNL